VAKHLSPTYRLLDHLLPNGLAYFVGISRGAGKSWRAISDELLTTTGIPVSHESLRLWFPEQENGDENAA
jgi:hypothetical protein